jgi:hypothetical protein
MKTIVLLAILAAAAVMAGNAVSVEPEPPTEYNAKWNWFRVHEVRCDRVGLDVYGCNDDAFLMYVGSPINLCGYDGVRMSISYMQEAADDGDYCMLYLDDGDQQYTLFHTFEDTDGPGDVSLMLDDFYGVRDLGIGFEWVSDSAGVDTGFRLYSIEMYGCNWGDGEYTNLFTWDATDDVTGHQTVGIDWMLFAGNMNCLAFEYGTETDAQGWWAIDNVELVADGESVMPLQAGGYGVEDFSSGGWYQDHPGGLPGEWEIGGDHIIGDMYAPSWQSDSAAHPGSPYQAETLSPWLTIGSDSMITLFFDTWFHPGGVGEHASLGCYTTSGHIAYIEQFYHLYDWEAYDYGTDVTDTSWGAIKAGF